MSTLPAPVSEASGRAVARTQPTLAPVPPLAAGQASRGTPEQAEALLQALSALGVDYRYGGKSPTSGFDCSGLVAHVFLEAYGVRLPANARAQSDAGQPVSFDELQPGDLVFYDTLNQPFSHVGIYLGDGKFIHAPRAGASVRVESLRSAYWSRRWNGARRIPLPA